MKNIKYYKIVVMTVLCIGAYLFVPMASAGQSRANVKPREVLKPGPLVTIKGAPGKFDFVSLDPLRHRLLASHKMENCIDIIDLNTNRLIKQLKASKEPCDAQVDMKTGRYFVNVQGSKRVDVFDGDSYALLNSINMDGLLDALFIVPELRRVYVCEDDGTRLWVMDADSYQLLATIDFAASGLELIAYDKVNHRIFVNVRETSETIVIDTNTNVIVARWSNAPMTGAHGIAFDAANCRIFSAGDNGIFVVIDTLTGKVISQCQVPELIDQIAFDQSTGRVYCAAYNTLSVVQITWDGKAQYLGDVKKGPGGRNVAVDPVTRTVWTAYSDKENSYVQGWLLP